MALTLKALLRAAALPPQLLATVEITGEAREGSRVAAGVAHVSGAGAEVVAALLEAAARREQERRALAGEVLHLYREVHLFEQLSGQLARLLDFSAVGEVALGQARRLIAATGGAVFVEGEMIHSFEETGGLAELAGQVMEQGVLGEGWLGAPLGGQGAIVLRGGEYTSVELKLLNTIALQTGVAIENARAMRDREQLAGLQRELETARAIQHSLVPRVFPAFPERSDFDVHAQMTSAKAVGGDFYDFFLIDERRLGLVIGDVSGKGIPAALYMAVTRTQIKTTALTGVDPAECLREVNRVLVRDKVSSMFATCFYGILNTETGEFRYSNAGHNPPYLLRSSGEVEAVPMTGGLPLGIFAKLKCTEGVVRVGEDEGLFLYTDGVPEATNQTGEDYTDERLKACLGEVGSKSCRGMLAQVALSLAAFTGGAAQSDDVTMLGLRRLS